MMAAQWETLYGRVMGKVHAGILERVEALSETLPTLASANHLVKGPENTALLAQSPALASNIVLASRPDAAAGMSDQF